MMTGLECGHKFCTHCWGDYLTTKIMEEGLGQSISCAAHGCDIIVDDVTVMKLVPDSRVKLKYQHLITNSFVEVSFDCWKAKAKTRKIRFHLFQPTNNSVIDYCAGVHQPIAPMPLRWFTLKLDRSAANVVIHFVLNVVKIGMIRCCVVTWKNGLKNVMTIRKHQIG